MAKGTPHSSTVFFLILLLLLLSTAPTPSHSLSDNQDETLVSLATSLMTRVANLRASRGDLLGSQMAQLTAKQLELGRWWFMFSVAWDYAEYFSRREFPFTEISETLSDVTVLLRCVAEFNQTNSDAERAAWVVGNYETALNTSKSLFTRIVRQSRTLREVIGTVEREVMEGEFLRDVLELGSSDLKGLILIFNDLAQQFNSIQATQKTVDGEVGSHPMIGEGCEFPTLGLPWDPLCIVALMVIHAGSHGDPRPPPIIGGDPNPLMAHQASTGEQAMERLKGSFI